MFNITFQQFKNFSYALIRHLYYGLKKSSKSQIIARFNICSQCPSVHPDKNQCLECGCYISQEKIFFNKLAWQDQQCPLDKW